MKELRDYQTEISKKANEILNELKIVYLSMEVRTGKTLTSLNTAKLFKAKNVLFITKKKAIQSIIKDYEDFEYNKYFDLVVTNNESLHKIDGTFDLLISDEHHRNGAFPKPNIVTKLIKVKYSNLPMIFLSGTPTPESYSQIYHQFWVSNYSPFNQFRNFYQWANNYVTIGIKYLGYANIKDYSKANNEKIKLLTDKYFLTYTQSDAGFTTKVNENILQVKMSDLTYRICNMLKKDKVIVGKESKIIADTGVKLMQKLHQLYSGSCIGENKEYLIIDYSKAEYIRKHFYYNKIAIFYKFKSEYELLKKVYNERLTDNLEEFNTTDKNIALQIVSGREGISLANAEFLVYFNIDFSAVSYWQSRDRLTTMERKENNVFWIFSENGIEEKIYKSVLNKKDYTLSVFKKDYGITKKDF